MLVLSRKLNEEIVIGNDITVKILRIKGGQIRLGVAAPQGVKIRRAELKPEEQDSGKDGK